MTEVHKSLAPKISLKSLQFLDIDVDKAEFAQKLVLEYHAKQMGQNLSPALLAKELKQAFDRRYGVTWHCAVGNSFGSSIAHENNQFIFFHVDAMAIMLFKTSS
ncbi:unnamed protein product [Bursaphelenchus okinawaensis]|uniref:Dynein light chain n=1 Tax=Bursaphelenchus okinawaensis TaxID=465554 RepID=A0A811KCG5_9BILA|nr:unnamed protein product [Bursaphelenchus okinawaensis]CAG9099529.1 unnamed protein product [Bursaphelenchus okinawaensis]